MTAYAFSFFPASIESQPGDRIALPHVFSPDHPEPYCKTVLKLPYVMNAFLMAVFAIAGSFLLLVPKTTYDNDLNGNSTSQYIYNVPDEMWLQCSKPAMTTEDDYLKTISSNDDLLTGKNSDWEQNAIQWLVEAQSPNGGWGAGSHAFQNIRDPHQVQTDPATTAFAAMALLKAGGTLKNNPYKKQIEKALQRILDDIKNRPNNGRITSLDGTQPQIKLGVHIDASMALQFLTAIRDDVADDMLTGQIDKAAEICIDLIQKSQNVDGGWVGGGWAPVLQSAMANNALERAQDRYEVDVKVIENSRRYQADNINEDGVKSDDAAGIPLYAAASAQRATAPEAKEVSSTLSSAILENFSSGVIDQATVVRELESKGYDRGKAERMVNSYAVNQASTKSLQSDAIWDGFGNNGGEEYLSYMLTSEALAHQNADEWKKWKQSIEPKFKQSQNPNGSWSGHHCITSPVFCTAAILQALHAL